MFLIKVIVYIILIIKVIVEVKQFFDCYFKDKFNLRKIFDRFRTWFWEIRFSDNYWKFTFELRFKIDVFLINCKDYQSLR